MNKLKASLQQMTKELKKVFAENHHLNQAVSSKHNGVNFSRSRLDEVQHADDSLLRQVRWLEWEIEQWRYS